MHRRVVVAKCLSYQNLCHIGHRCLRLTLAALSAPFAADILNYVYACLPSSFSSFCIMRLPYTTFLFYDNKCQ